MDQPRPTILVFASGSRHGGGSGFRKLVEASRSGALNADIVGVVSNHEHGGVRKHAEELGIPFYHLTDFTEEGYRKVAKQSGAEWFCLSGWLKLVVGLPPTHTINIHPGPLPEYGGEGMYGRHVHEAVLAAYHRGELTHSAVTMHFVMKGYDKGPIIAMIPVPIMPDDTAITLAERVNKIEHKWQWHITDLVVHGNIRWDGIDPASLVCPKNLFE